MIPERLETQRLVLRRHRRADAPRLAQLLNNWEVVRWLAQVPFPYTEKDALDWISQTGRNWVEGRDYQFVAVLKETNEVVGHIGIRMDVPRPTGELGYWFGQPYWGLGYGAEAARAMVAFGFLELKLERLWATYLPENVRSLTVLSKAGLMPDGFKSQEFSTLKRTVNCPMMAIDRAEYLQTATMAETRS